MGIRIIILTGLVAMLEIFLAASGDIRYLHGMDFFTALCLRVLPVVFLFIHIVFSFLRKKTEKSPGAPPAASGETLAGAAQKGLQAMRNSFPEFSKDIEQTQYQIERYEKKKKTVLSLCQDRRTSEQESRCAASLEAADRIFYSRIQDIFRLLQMFDGAEYRLFVQNRLDIKDAGTQNRKKEFYNKLFHDVDAITDANEGLILRVDELASVLSRRISTTDWGTDTIVAMNRLDKIIQENSSAFEDDREVSLSVMEQLTRLGS